MSEYHGVKLALSVDQRRKLSKGLTVQIKKSQYGHGHTTFLTKRQITKIHSNFKKGMGVRITLSQSQLEYQARHGKGFFDWLKSAASTVYDNVIKPIARPLLNAGLSAATSRLGPGIGQTLANQAGTAGINMLGDKLGFGVLRIGRIRMPKKGSSFAAIGRARYAGSAVKQRIGKGRCGGSFAPAGGAIMGSSFAPAGR